MNPEIVLLLTEVTNRNRFVHSERLRLRKRHRQQLDIGNFK